MIPLGKCTNYDHKIEDMTTRVKDQRSPLRVKENCYDKY